MDSKRILKIILKGSKVFKVSRSEGIDSITYLIKDSYLLCRMVLKKFGDPSAVSKNMFIFFYSNLKLIIPTYKYLIEKSTELQKNKKFKKIFLKQMLYELFGNFKEEIWNQRRKKSYSTKCLVNSMLKHKLNNH